MSWEAGEKSHNSGKYVYEDGVRPLTDAAVRWGVGGGVGTKGISEEQRTEGEDEDEGTGRRRREEERGS